MVIPFPFSLSLLLIRKASDRSGHSGAYCPELVFMANLGALVGRNTSGQEHNDTVVHDL